MPCFVAICAFFYTMIRELVKDIEAKMATVLLVRKPFQFCGVTKNTSALNAFLDRICGNNYLGLSRILLVSILYFTNDRHRILILVD